MKIEIYGVNISKEELLKLIKFFGLDDIIYLCLAEGQESSIIPLYCVNGYLHILYSDGTKINIGERCNGNNIQGFIIKLKSIGDLYHELEHASRYIKHKSQNEILVELSSYFKKLCYSVIKWLKR